MIVGVTGKYCAGKSTLVKILRESGFQVIDVDRIGHIVLAELRSEVVNEFGTEVTRENGTIERSMLGEIVFRDSRKRENLEHILHPEMVKRVESELKKKGRRVAIDAALLQRMGLHTLCDIVVCVKAPVILQIARGMKRDKLSLFHILRRLASQRENCPKSKGFAVDTYYVWNLGNIQSLQKKVLNIIEKLN